MDATTAAAAGIRMELVEGLRDHRRLIVPLNDSTPPTLRLPLPEGFVIRLDRARYAVVCGEADVDGGAWAYTVRALRRLADVPPGASTTWPTTLW